ncbi:MAG: PDZ domain-containing protein [Nitrospira sp.]|nr:PDZ domain-containing protein [Nitrospira sp.]
MIQINKILPGSPAEGLLKRGDVLLAINGHLIGDDSTVEFRPLERTHYR